jgi:outer membrane protein assembly factor BamB
MDRRFPQVLIGLAVCVWAAASAAAGPADSWPYYSAHNRACPAKGLQLVGDFTQAKKVWETRDAHAGCGKALYGGQRRQGEELGISILPGGTSAPIVAEDTVFIAYYRPSGDARVPGPETTFRTTRTRDGWNPDIWCIGADDCLVAIDAATGRKKWLAENKGRGLNRVTIKRGDWGSGPCYADGKVFFVGTTGRVYAHDAGTGRLLWESKTAASEALEKAKAEAIRNKAWGPKQDNLHTSPIVADGVLVVPAMVCGGLMGLDARDGRVLWTLVDRREQYQAILGTPRIWRHEGRQYVLAHTTSGTLSLIAPRDGRVLWREAFDCPIPGTFALEGDIAVLNVKPGATEKGQPKAALWGGRRISLTGAEKVWSLPDEPRYWHQYNPDSGPRAGYAVGDGVAWLWAGDANPDKQNTPERFLAVDTNTGRILSETDPQQKHIHPQVVGDRLIVWSDYSHGDPIRLSYWTADPAGPRRLNDAVAVPVSAITGYLVTMDSPFVDGRLYVRTMGGAACLDLRKGE